MSLAAGGWRRMVISKPARRRSVLKREAFLEPHTPRYREPLSSLR